MNQTAAGPDRMSPAVPKESGGSPALKSNYTNLDLLRSLAVLSVVAAHLWHQGVEFHLWADSYPVTLFLHNLSFTGVMFFFVHTCLVLMLSMHRAPAAGLARSFLIRRAFRIYPLCWATIALSLITGLTDEPAGTFHALGWPGVAVNVFLVHNVIRAYSSVIGPLWSLDWEVQMYLVLPLFFLLLRRSPRLRVVFLLWLGAALLAVGFTHPALPRMFHAAIFPPMFIGGMVAYKLLSSQAQTPRRWALPAWAWPFFVLALFAVQSLLMGERSYESSPGAALDAIICLVLALAIPAFRELRAAWVVRPAQQIAKYSYGIYLLHVPALIFVLRYLPALPIALKIALFFALTGLMSVLSFHAIEDPLIRMGKRLAQRATAARAPQPAFVPAAPAAPAPRPAGHPIPAVTMLAALAATEALSPERMRHAPGLDRHPGL
jgi:peptidoglycan/LPS O-acetylase OafA/YrhL